MPEAPDSVAEAGQRAAMEPRWAGYAEYCRLRAAGLRPQALVALDALAQAPADPVAVKLVLRAVLQWVDYAQHELPGCYLGDPAEDIALLERAATLSTDPDQRNLIDHRLEAARRALTDRNPHGN